MNQLCIPYVLSISTGTGFQEQRLISKCHITLFCKQIAQRFTMMDLSRVDFTKSNLSGARQNSLCIVTCLMEEAGL